ncbi:DUF5412 domain-containing protein [Clostridium sp. MSJ-4]|uniref:DUF5412 domain-containing protein n=1 Tax=Clostridium simiarum TaxID=2841506 RepID=A0ABS6F4D9_9CLOT|nr:MULTISPECIES: DUF5412 family protein [Clostridium]MBU5593382.1 DUF5412 domain-containing protein [Clostridium simiarum]
MYKKSLVFASILIALFSLLFYGCKDISSNTIVKELESPNKEIKAIAFIKEGGATVDFSPQVSILKNNKKFRNESGNVFVGNHSKYVDIHWENNNTLIVIYDCEDKDILKKIDEIDGIKVKYEKSDKDHSK